MAGAATRAITQECLDIVTSRTAAHPLTAAFALALAACSTDTITPDAPKAVNDLSLAPYEIVQECVQVIAGDRIDYRFEAKAPVKFEIHYQDGIMFVAPITREEILEFGGIFVPPSARRYCLQWEAGPQGAAVDYRIRLLRGNTAP